MRDQRFFIWANSAVPSVDYAWATCVDGCAVRQICRCGRDWGRVGGIGPSRSACHVGAGFCLAARERATLYAGPAVITDHATYFARECQSSPRCVMGYGRGRNLRRFVRCHRRDTRCAERTKLHGNQTAGPAGQDIRHSPLSDPHWRSRCVECSTRTMAGGVTAIACKPPRPAGSGSSTVGFGSLSCAWPGAGALGGAI